jgi:hypothetical protein
MCRGFYQSKEFGCRLLWIQDLLIPLDFFLIHQTDIVGGVTEQIQDPIIRVGE